eukprot:746560-Hanusia_phi.AAC.3
MANRLVPAWTVNLEKLGDENEKENAEGNRQISMRGGKPQLGLRAQTARNSTSLHSPIMKARRFSTIECSPKHSPLTVQGATKTMVTPSPFRLQAWRAVNTEGNISKRDRRAAVRTMRSGSLDEEAKRLFLHEEERGEDPALGDGNPKSIGIRRDSRIGLCRIRRGSMRSQGEEESLEKESTRSSLSSSKDDDVNRKKMIRETRAKPWQVDKQDIRRKVRKTMIVASVKQPPPLFSLSPLPPLLQLLSSCPALALPLLVS